MIFCNRDLESELGEPPAVIDEDWDDVDLQVWLRLLEQQKQTGRSTPVKMTLEELEYYRRQN